MILVSVSSITDPESRQCAGEDVPDGVLTGWHVVEPPDPGFLTSEIRGLYQKVSRVPSSCDSESVRCSGAEP